MTTENTTAGSGPVVFAYDGSELARRAIEEAGKLMGSGQDAIVLTVWQPFDVGFIPAGGVRFDSAAVQDVRKSAEQTAAEGASLAKSVGFKAEAAAAETAPIWKAIVEFADQHDARLIVLGSHGRSGIADLVIGSVAGAVASHSKRSVLITHRRS
jgi:nucleotide-binding universal stress UspA family protein